MLDRKLRQAADALRRGDDALAERVSRQVLARAPRNPGARHLLGVVYLRRGDHGAALAHLREATAADPHNGQAFADLGVAALSVRDFAAAEQAFRRAVNLGNEDAATLCWLGIALASQEKHLEAGECFARGITREPRHAGLHVNLGNVRKEQGRLAEAIACYERALQLEPGHAEAHNNLGNSLLALGKTEEAIAEFERALSLNPEYPDAFYNLGNALRAQWRLDAAVDCYRRALALDERQALTHHNLGNALLEQGRTDEARACFERAIALQSDYAQAHDSLGTAWQESGEVAKAISCFERALVLDPARAEPRYNLGLARLYGGGFEGAWALYEARLVSEGVREKLRKDGATVELFESLPRWAGAVEEPGRRVAIWAEQGIGDQLLFSSLIPELVAAGVDFVYEVDGRLLGAYERAFAGSRFVALSDPPHAALREAERVLWSGSLPGFFRASRESFARQPQRLLSALPQRVAHYRGRLDELGPGLRVALSWRSSRTDRVGPKKNVALAQFAPLLAHSGVHFVDVQYGDTAAERGEVERHTGVRLAHFEEVDYFNDLEEVLAILEACDLLITTSNVNAHLGGVLGKRTWLLYLADNPPFHYWAHAGAYRSHYYPSVEILTSPALRDWSGLAVLAARKLSGTLDARAP